MKRRKRAARRKKPTLLLRVVGFAGLAGLAVGAVWLARQVGGAGVAAATAAAVPDAGAPAPIEKVKLTFYTVPPVPKAEVRWGKRLLGVVKGKNKPFILERVRDSGPLDLIIKAEGFIPVNTRAYTFNDNKIYVKLTPVAEKHTLFGFRQEIPDGGAEGVAPGAVAPDGGVAPVPPAPPPVIPGTAPAPR